MRGGEVVIVVLDEMEMLDQQVAAARPVGQQRAHLLQCDRIDLTALRRPQRPTAAFAADVRGFDVRHWRAHNYLRKRKKNAFEGS